MSFQVPTDQGDDQYSAVQKINLPWKQLSNVPDIARILRVASGPLHVNLIGNDLADLGTERLTEELLQINIQDLNLACNHIGNGGACAIAGYLRTNMHLQHLCLFGNVVCDVGCAELAKALRHNHALQTLNLSYNNVGSDGAMALGVAIREFCSLIKLDLTGNSIGDEGATVLADALLYETNIVQDLVLSRNAITDVGAIAFANALTRNCPLERLRLADNELGDTGAKALAASLKHNTKLRLVDLRFNDTIGSKSRYHFLTMLETSNTSLRTCDLLHAKAHLLQQQLDYWCELNRNGRSMARFEEGAQMLPLVLERSNMRPDLLYGLLSETPHVWSGRC
jgi:hypothetical protein